MPTVEVDNESELDSRLISFSDPEPLMWDRKGQAQKSGRVRPQTRGKQSRRWKNWLPAFHIQAYDCDISRGTSPKKQGGLSTYSDFLSDNQLLGKMISLPYELDLVDILPFWYSTEGL